MHPLVLHAHVAQRGSEHRGVVGIAERRYVHRVAVRQRHAQAVLQASERIALQPVVQRVHEDDEEQRCERVALSQTALDVERVRQAIGRAHAGREAGEAVDHEVDEVQRHAQAMQSAPEHAHLH